MSQQQRTSVVHKRHVNNQPRRFMKTSTIAVETLRSTSQSDTIVRQINKQSPKNYFAFIRQTSRLFCLLL